MKFLQMEFGTKKFNKVKFNDPLKRIKLDSKTNTALIKGSMDSDFVKIWEPRSKKD